MTVVSRISVILWTLVVTFGSSDAGGGGGSAYVPLAERLEHAPAPTIQSVYVPVIDYLKEHYVTMAMPVCHEGDVMETKIDVWLYQLYGLDEPTQALTVDVWIDMTWNDCQLKWDPDYFNNITQITLPAGEIWYPDILFYQSLHGNFEEGLFIFRESVARVRYDGTVQLGAQVLLRSFCRVKIDYFPFDSQYCNITFASWNKDARVFRLVKRDSDGHDEQVDDSIDKSIDTKRGHSFKEASNGEWEVIGFPSFDTVSEIAVGADEGMKLNYSEVTFQLQLKRKPNYVLVYLVFPCVLLIWVSTITFLLPLESGEKVNLSVTILLSLIVFLLLVADNIPRTADSIPTLGVFYTLSIVLVSLSVLMETIVLNFGLKTLEIKLPWRIKKIMKCRIWRVVLFHYAEHSQNHEWISLGMMKQHQQDCNTKNEEDECPEVAMLTEDYTAPPCVKNDWRFFAMLLDRLFYLIYVLLTIGLTIYIYTYQPTDTRGALIV